MSVLLLSGEKKPTAFDYVNMFLLLCLSGITFFSGNEMMLMLVFAINVVIFLYRKTDSDSGFWGFLVFFILLTAAQILWFQDGSFTTYIGFVIRICTAYLVVKNISDFISTFLRLLCFLSIAGIFFYAFFVAFPSIEDQLFFNKHPWDSPSFHDLDKSLIIYNIHREPLFGVESHGLFGLPRNSGPFWEPGANGGYLVLGIATEMLLTRKMSKRVLVFLAALLTTFSTSAYLALGVFFLLYFLLVDNKPERLLILLPILAIVVWISIFSLDFLADKIEHQFKEFNEGNKSAGVQSENDTRIGSANLDFNDLMRSPLFGTGSSDETRWGPGEQLFFRSNGLTDFLVRVGLIGFVYAFIFLLSSSKKFFRRLGLTKVGPASAVFTIMTFFVCLGETFFITVFFWSLFFIQYNNLATETEAELKPGMQ